MRRICFILLYGLLLAVTASCGTNRGGEPLAEISGSGMFPDYTDITIPCNIAPLNFRIDGSTAISVQVSGKSQYKFKCRGPLMRFPLKAWRKMLEAEAGEKLQVNVSFRTASGDGQLDGFFWQVAPEPLDRFLSYRLIEPAYEVWNNILVEERNVENFNARLLGDNTNAGKCCMNCHTSNGGGTSYMHLRGATGGTLLNRNGNLLKLDTRTDSTMGGAVYGDISADGRYGVFAAAGITFAMHSRTDMRMEVYDTASDLLVVDFDSLTVTDSRAVKGTEYQETFPCFSADGKLILFCRAKHLEQPDSTMRMMYDIAAVSFDPATGRVGDSVRTLMSGARHNVSFSHLKCSPDNRFLLVTAAQYGTFPIWHPESQLWLIDIKTGHINVMSRTNAPGADTYHSWSSNSRWIAFASKRDDGVYGRPYIAFIDTDGNSGKPFVLPQRDPDVYRTSMKSYNLPELYTVGEPYNARTTASVYSKMETTHVTYKPNY